MKTEFKIWWINYFMHPFAWSRWCDICTFNFGYTPYLLQGKLNRRSNAKKFRVTAITNKIGVAYPGSVPISTLDEKGLIDSQVKFNS